MNSEINRIREEMGMPNIKQKWLCNNKDDFPKLLLIRELNTNLSKYYSVDETYSLEEYIDAVTKNIYLILELLSEMNVYPQYFMDLTMDMHEENYICQKKSGTIGSHIDDTINNTYDGKVAEAIKNKRYKSQAQVGEARNIEYYFDRMIDFCQKNKISFGIDNEEDIKTIFEECILSSSIKNEDLLISATEIDEIEAITELLYCYLCFFVKLGINPSDYLNAYMNEKLGLSNVKK